jgi:hypothetical protein
MSRRNCCSACVALGSFGKIGLGDREEFGGATIQFSQARLGGSGNCFHD